MEASERARRAGLKSQERLSNGEKKVRLSYEDYSDEEFEFIKAMDDYKSRTGRNFPTLRETLKVLHQMGYQKVGRSA